MAAACVPTSQPHDSFPLARNDGSVDFPLACLGELEQRRSGEAMVLLGFLWPAALVSSSRDWGRRWCCLGGDEIGEGKRGGQRNGGVEDPNLETFFCGEERVDRRAAVSFGKFIGSCENSDQSCVSCLRAVRVPFFPPAATFFPPTTALISGVPFFQTATATLFPGGDGLPAMIFRNKS
ncbi:hypothetical protein EJB05_30288, partial [Eragrostis curvula]